MKADFIGPDSAADIGRRKGRAVTAKRRAGGRVTAMITRMSRLFLRTLRDDPADAEVPSHKLLVRAGYIRRHAPGIYSWLPLGLKVLRNIEDIVREDGRNRRPGDSFRRCCPQALRKSNRWTEYGDDLFRLKDRKKADYLLSPTHEECSPSR